MSKPSRARHVVKVDPRTHEVKCSCGDQWSGIGAVDSANEHVDAATSRAGCRADRLGTLAGGKTTERAAEAWGLTPGGAFAYLRGLEFRRLVRKKIVGKFPRRAIWTLGEGAPR